MYSPRSFISCSSSFLPRGRRRRGRILRHVMAKTLPNDAIYLISRNDTTFLSTVAAVVRVSTTAVYYRLLEIASNRLTSSSGKLLYSLKRWEFLLFCKFDALERFSNRALRKLLAFASYKPRVTFLSWHVQSTENSCHVSLTNRCGTWPFNKHRLLEARRSLAVNLVIIL